MKILLALFLALAASAAHAVCTPNQGRYTVGASSASLEVCATDGTTWAGIGGGGSLPSGMIALFNSACPAGWTEFTAARGRTVVGVPAAGTLAGTVGTALTDLQDKTHSHTYTDVVNHTHTVTVNDPGHNHTQNSFAPRIVNSGTAGTVGVQGASSASNANASNAATTATNQSATTGITATTANPAGGVATGTTSTKATSDVIAYIQLRYCTKD